MITVYTDFPFDLRTRRTKYCYDLPYQKGSYTVHSIGYAYFHKFKSRTASGLYNIKIPFYYLGKSDYHNFPKSVDEMTLNDFLSLNYYFEAEIHPDDLEMCIEKNSAGDAFLIDVYSDSLQRCRARFFKFLEP